MTISEQSTKNESMRSDIYALFAALMRSAPKEDVLDWLQGIEISEGADSQMSDAWTQLSLAAAIYSAQDIADEYQLLFIGIGRGEVMPFASWHLTGSLMEKPLALIRQDLERLGFERNEHTKEPEDHIAALCEVMSLLESEIEQNSFFNRHIQAWFEKLTVQIKQAEHAQFYAALATVMNQFLLIEQTRFARVPVRETKMIATEQ
ncbi:Putative formate dehydrogenase-specific chaperone [Vibrio nigripulchritudo SO65]|uniref:TorD/DmsD family molecular chaperone n=1 Tax=Vibrio nigripulchritudo TaxID=28173 RepID=UPI0003B19B2A|nr:molecular chaperone TorD family protein [Vibrio nigripulchritudo]CCN34433.1 Putative formate dehydrogenase-specific chaperone [Vibrio nigripulchritudo AM115]CCN43310.1 Putative formate dehydrogenase-specific chaperone [Vibrio nigripulchritudo FTn2]CCN63732.1 Putative formate dehydrogenase-specific chaperone [Vibrio nigripulchritudo POn4]CCN77057.1 Putative formate dehydrogenase-specific chaperone [Vibrio nigripulchritudo SO65]